MVAEGNRPTSSSGGMAEGLALDGPTEPKSESLREISIGIIGMGEMGRMYASRLYAGGYRRINVCDRPEHYERLREEFQSTGYNVLRDGHLVSRMSDFIIYSVEAEFIDRVVAEFGPSTKLGAIVAGQTSVKEPERKAFEKYLPADVHIVSLHSLHGPTVNPEGQALIIIQHRAPADRVRLVERIMSPLRSRPVYLSYQEHDIVTANTQAVTHAAFLSMGLAWRCSGQFPWETGRYVGGIEVAKINITLRIYSQKWHVYAGLAILNPAARIQIDQYAASVTALFKLMIEEKEHELRDRVNRARAFVFGEHEAGKRPLLISEDVFDRFAVGPKKQEIDPLRGSPPNSHLSLLAMVDCWHALGIQPLKHLDLAATPLFRMWFGVAEYLFRDPLRLEAAIMAATHDKSHRSDDTEFTVAARGWSQCVSFGSFEWYRARFEETATFFQPRFEESRKQAADMLREILADAK